MKKIMYPFLFMAIGMQPACASGNFKDVSPEEFKKIIDDPKVIILDVRTPEEFSEGHIKGAINADVNQPGFVEKVEQIVPKDSLLAVYCRSGRRSAHAVDLLQRAGYKGYHLAGGILDWEKAGLPIESDNHQIDDFTTTSGKIIEIEPLIHASLRIVYDGKEIEIDPVGKYENRTTDYASFPKADYILVTHEHFDHLDKNAIDELSDSNTVLIVNQRVKEIIGEGTVLKNGEKLEFPDNIEIEAVPAYNTSADKLQFHPKGRDNGYVLTLDGFRIYIAGDTEPIPEMAQLKDIDVAFLPCNLPYTMTPKQLIEAAEIIHPKIVYPYHFGTTDLSPIEEGLKNSGIEVRIRPFD